MKDLIEKAARIILDSKNAIVFTGAGISVESGIPPFRGEGGLWNVYNPDFIEINHFFKSPEKSWKLIKEIFYDFFGKSKANPAHFAVAELEKMGIIKVIITQNIDNLHQDAGSKKVIEFHGTSQNLVCTGCNAVYHKNEVDLTQAIPSCKKCSSMLKPDFIFFGEGIPEPAGSLSFQWAQQTDCVIVVGTTGEVMPACQIPWIAKRNGAKVIEINPSVSTFTHHITDVFLNEKAGKVLPVLLDKIKEQKTN